MAEIAAGEVAKARSAERPGPFVEFWRYFRENRGAVIGLIFLGIVVALALAADFVAPHSPYEQYRTALLKPPAWEAGGSSSFILGTDAVGRDILSRLIHGARYSLFIGAVVVALSLTGGIVLGLISGYARGLVDTFTMRVMDIILAFPALLLALVVVAILGSGLFNTMVAVAIAYLPHFVRLTRGAVLAERTKDYVIAARVAGAGPLRLMFKSILPNCTAPLIV